MFVKEKIISILIKTLQGLGFRDIDVELEHPTEESFGDYSSNIAMKLKSPAFVPPKAGLRRGKQNFKNPRELAQVIVDELNKNKDLKKYISKIEIAGSGFINFWLSEEYLITSLIHIIEVKKEIGRLDVYKNKKVMVEFAHPNTHKAFHIGHLRNISIGESIVRILENIGYKVIRSNYQGDVGIHIAKCLWGILKDSKFTIQTSRKWTLEQRAKYMGQAYVIGSNAYDEDKKANQEIKDINYLIYASAQKYQEKEHGVKPGSTDYMKFVAGKKYGLDKIYELWVETRQWSLDYFTKIYKRVYSYFDKCYFESQCLAGVDSSYEALKKGILKESEGAIVFDGKKYGLDTRVFVNSLGLPTYEGKELALAPMELSDFGHLDKIIHVVTPEQTSFFKVTFKAEELLGIQSNQQYHLAYGWVKLKAGKMASREGNVILAEWLLDEVKKRLNETFSNLEESSVETISVGAVKYSFLKHSADKDIAFDIGESVSLEGNSGPYLQYTYARARSVLRKSEIRNPKFETNLKFEIQNSKVTPEELSILRALHKFPEVVLEAGENLAPNLVCNYLFDLAQKFNLFYQKIPILGDQRSEVRDQRLQITQAVSIVLKKGLYLLGIEVLEKM